VTQREDCTRYNSQAGYIFMKSIKNQHNRNLIYRSFVMRMKLISQATTMI